MEPLIFYEKHLAGGSEPNRDMLIKEGVISLDGREDIKGLHLYFEDSYIAYLDTDGGHYQHWGIPGSAPHGYFDLDIWRSGDAEISYRIMLEYAYGKASEAGQVDGAFTLSAEFDTGEDISLSIPFSIFYDPGYTFVRNPRLDPILLQAMHAYVPETVDWDFGGLENLYIPGHICPAKG